MAETRPTLLQRLEAEALQIRRNVWRAFHVAGSGHVGGSASAADLLAALYFHTLNVRPYEPDWPDRDRFVLSKGHANAALAAVLVQAEFLEDALLDRFYGYESPLGMHPDIKVAGVEMSTGGLGHGLSVGVGMALGARLQGKSFHTYVMLGDGELHEGSNWEAAGCMVEMAVRASQTLESEGIGVRVLNMHTIKPLDCTAILQAAAETRGIVTAEEHHLTGGLGGAVAELLAVERPTRMRLVGMPDAFAVVGPTVPLRAKYGMSTEAIVEACQSLLSVA